MARLDSRSVLVLDLDDTLYKERDYHSSGIAAVCALVEDVYGRTVAAEVAALQAGGERDLLGAICRMLDLPATAKESLLWAYRLHAPSIALSDATRAAIDGLRDRHELLILTDGRSISQRRKLTALGLADIPAYISEEYGSEKPAPLRFEVIMRDYSQGPYVYVADNPRKDFLAPNALGWLTFGLRGDERNIHGQSCSALAPEYHPQVWISSLDELL